MRYGSVCSGIEAATLAWESLGWKPAWFSEIEPFPCAVLNCRWPQIVNLGDMTKIAAAVRDGEVEAPDVMVGGTPCQAFSVAGLRNGLSDARGQLTLSYVELANAIDEKRRESGEQETIFVWENVPGVLSSKDNAFGCLLAGLAGESEELQSSGRKWTNAGCVFGPQRTVAWIVKDAQYFGVAQRRHRVFVVASARDDIDPTEILFECEGVRRDSAPSREARSAVAALTANGVGTCGADDNQGQAGHLIPTALVECITGDVTHTLKADGFDGSEDGTGRGIPIVFAPDVAPTLRAGGNRTGGDRPPGTDVDTADSNIVTYGFQPRIGRNGRGDMGDICHALSAQAGITGKGDNAPCVALAFQERTRAGGRKLETNGDLAYALTAPCGGGRAQERNVAIALQDGVAVRRLTPVECERLQGFPDNHTLIPGTKLNRLTADELAHLRTYFPDIPDEEAHRLAADGPRYKAIGNSMAVPVMRWLGRRIDEALKKSNSGLNTPKIKYQRPFLKWAGGKFSLLSELGRYIPSGNRLIEPFVGAGSVFLNSDKHAEFFLADVNADLINLYQMLAVVPGRVLQQARLMFERMNNSEHYSAIRDAFNAQRMDATERAAAFLYLNRHCFNGLMRYNGNNQFNVSFGKYTAPYFPDKEISAFLNMAHNCVFMNAGYRRTLSLAGADDVVYCDPPYEPLPGTNGFTAYSAGGFSWDDQVSLVECCIAAHQRGASVVISNSTSPRIIELYDRYGFELHHISARRSISSKGNTRGVAKDLVAIMRAAV